MLTMMAIMASVLVVIMRIEGHSAEMQLQALQSELLLSAGLDHAKTMLSVAHRARRSDANAAPLPSLLFGTTRNGEPASERDTDWINVRDSSGALFGRYRLRIEDEAAKLNVNSAALLDASKGSGWSMAEVNLPNAIGISPKFAQ